MLCGFCSGRFLVWKYFWFLEPVRTSIFKLQNCLFCFELELIICNYKVKPKTFCLVRVVKIYCAKIWCNNYLLAQQLSLRRNLAQKASTVPNFSANICCAKQISVVPIRFCSTNLAQWKKRKKTLYRKRWWWPWTKTHAKEKTHIVLSVHFFVCLEFSFFKKIFKGIFEYFLC